MFNQCGLKLSDVTTDGAGQVYSARLCAKQGSQCQMEAEDSLRAPREKKVQFVTCEAAGRVNSGASSSSLCSTLFSSPEYRAAFEDRMCNYNTSDDGSDSDDDIAPAFLLYQH
eukprot:Rhum_TRINITY_DN15522_c1_g1::Rhum_TRINITY_DN15522_c1_g1_i1::g.161125::m.161125